MKLEMRKKKLKKSYKIWAWISKQILKKDNIMMKLLKVCSSRWRRFFKEMTTFKVDKSLVGELKLKNTNKNFRIKF